MRAASFRRWATRTGATGREFIERVKRSQPDVYVARKLGSVLPDRAYLALAYRLNFGVWPDYDNPRSLNEHIHAYILRCRSPMLKVTADKVATRKLVGDLIGERYLVPMYGVWESADEVPLESLPRPCVLKPSAASGAVEFLLEDEAVDVERLRARMRTWQRRDYSRIHREWAYSGLRSKILAEQMLREPDGSSVPVDYKAYVIGGKVRFIQVDRGRFASHTRNLYSPAWDLLPARMTVENHSPDPRPKLLEEFIEISERLSEPFEFLRVDVYMVGERIYVGELTNTPGGGFERFIPESFASEVGAYWQTP